MLDLKMTSADPVSFTACLSPIDGPMIQHVIIVPEEVAKLFRQPKGAVRIVCSIKGQAEFPCALNPRGKDYVIMASLILIRQHNLLPAVPFPVSIRIDLNNGLLLPEELEEVLEQDDWGKQLFEAMLPGRKRGLIYYIRTAKSPDTRIKRALDIIERLKTGKLHVNKSEKD
jgi:Bacteriocin-protection, YdeI or OmpD-Associated